MAIDRRTVITESGIKTGINFNGLKVIGVCTATTYHGDGSALTGVASTENIKTSTPATFSSINASGIVTATGGIKVGTGLTIFSDGSIDAGIVTASNFSGGTGTFSGNVTISGDLGVGGTITYEDVARVDAVGLSTYREGLHVGPLAGIAATVYKDGSIRTTGVITATTYYGSGANLTGIDATQIQTGNTSVQTVDTGSDGHVKVLTEGSERARILSDGKLLLGATSASNAENFRIHTGSGSKAIMKFTNTDTGSAAGDGFEFGLGSDEVVEFWNKENTDIKIATNNTERLRIDSNGMSKFTRGSGGTVGHFYANARECNILLQNDARTWKIVNYDYGDNGSDNLGFHDGTADRMIIQNDGSVKIGDGDLIIGTSGHGINFAANTDGGGTATGTLLDDYEQGTYSTTIVSSNLTADSSSGTGYYTKIGNMVYCRGKLGMNTQSGSPSKSGSDGITQALPYAIKSGGTVFSGTMLQQNINWGGPTSLAHPHYFNPVASGYICMAASDGVRFYMNRVEYAYLRLTNDHLHVGYPGYTDIYWNLVYETD